MKILGMDFSCVLGSLRHGQIPEKNCLLPLISKLLGYSIVAASTTVKIPQILKILEHKSVRGLSAVAFELEVIGYTISLAYCLHKGLPFSAFGEYAFLLVQAIILVGVIYYFSQPVGTSRWMRAMLYCGLAPTILAGKIDPMLFEALYASQHAIFLCARIPQIWKNFSSMVGNIAYLSLLNWIVKKYLLPFCIHLLLFVIMDRNKSTGELSFLTCFMNFGGSMVRVFTSNQEKAPTSVVTGFGAFLATFMSFYGGLCKIIVYRKPETKKEKKAD